jgi:microcompartment protein CcmL/EutN
MPKTKKNKIVDSIGVLELRSIARGIEAGDAMLKAADVQLLQSTPVCSGKYVVVVGGPVADVQAAMAAGKHIGSDIIIDELLIPNVHEDVFPALMAATSVEDVESIGVIETLTSASGIVAADLAAKEGRVKLIEIRIARGLGGKAYVVLAGEVSGVRAAVEAGSAAVAESGLLLQSVVIPSIHPRMLENLL